MSEFITNELATQRERLSAIFTDAKCGVSCTTDHRSVDEYVFHLIIEDANNYKTLYHECSWVDFQDAFDSLMRHAGITTVEQYTRIKACKAKGRTK